MAPAPTVHNGKNTFVFLGEVFPVDATRILFLLCEEGVRLVRSPSSCGGVSYCSSSHRVVVVLTNTASRKFQPSRLKRYAIFAKQAHVRVVKCNFSGSVFRTCVFIDIHTRTSAEHMEHQGDRLSRTQNYSILTNYRNLTKGLGSYRYNANKRQILVTWLIILVTCTRVPWRG